jgi:hypothetical protein
MATPFDPIATLVQSQNYYIQILQKESLSPKPSYDLDGQQVSWTEYQSKLQEWIEGINKLLQMFQPFEIRTTAIN